MNNSATLTKVRYSHDAMIDAIISQPGVHQNALANLFGYTAAWVSTIMASDAFKERLAARREEIIDPELKLSIEERFRGLTTRSLQVLQEKLSAPASLIPDQLALKAAELGAKGLAIGGFSSRDPLPQPLPGGQDRLLNLAERLITLNQRSKLPEVIDGEIIQQE